MDEVADVFDDWARRGRAEGMEEGHGQTAGPTLAGLAMRDGTRFLDLGCGNAWAARSAADRGATAAAIDASAEMVARAAALATEQGLALDVRRGDFAELPWADDSFDLVWSMEALYYAPDPDAVLAEVRRVCAPGANVHVLIDHYTENEASHSWPADTGLAMALRSESEWADAFRAAGFDDVSTSRLRSDDPDADAWKREQGTLHLHARAGA